LSAYDGPVVTPLKPKASTPIMYGAPAPPGELLPWETVHQRLVDARYYWIATTRPNGRPHCRPVWGVWLPDGFWFSTGSLARRNLPDNPEITVHLEDAYDPIIVEGTARQVTEHAALEAMCDVYSAKYNYAMVPTDDGMVGSSDGSSTGPAFHVTPRVVFAWSRGSGQPTRWTFA
jgi:hypothetical protein